MLQPILSLHNVTIRCADQSRFNDICFTVNEGEHWALVGENLSLRNALIDAIAGNVSVINGQVDFPFYHRYVQTYEVKDSFFSPRKLIASVTSRHSFRNLSNTTQFYYQQRFNSSDSENSLTVEEFLSSIISSNHHLHWSYSRTIDELHLDHLLDEQLIKLSNGETKRVLIAEALLRNPLVLLLNNPLTGLDVQSRQEISASISKIAATGITIIMSISANEIPEAITHIATCNNENNITKSTKETFDPTQVVNNKDHQISAAEVKALLSITGKDKYEDVVYMKNVSIKYGDKVILDKINWRIKQGERWALVGPNGSGKSTLLSLVNGDNPQAFANDIILFDRKKGSGESIWDIKKKIGFFSPELYQYFPFDITCLDTVECGFYDTIGLFRPRQNATTAIALHWMRLLGIEHLSGKLLGNILANNQRLCLLARALVKSPPLLIFDEPLQGLEEYQREHFKQLVDTICSLSNVTLIYVSHYKNEMPGSITKVLRLERGKQLEEAG
ncbi:MAG TPA: ATP-binding cassette domain-containing protein [Chitinophagaceae bacterium]|nr:ATP-binding cassette domain-containing protein [Chitinophagaceae bacterium]